MSRIFFTLMLFLVISCSTKETATMSTVSTAATTSADTLLNSRAINDMGPDSSIFISFANPFVETDEFYVPLFYKEGSAGALDPSQLDSVIVEEEEYTRKRIPLEIAREYFMLGNLDAVLVFGSDHKLLGEASLKRVEFVEDMISSQVVAVYKAPRTMKAEHGPYYCISNDYRGNGTTNFASQDIAVNKSIVSDLFDPAEKWVMNHVKVLPSEKIYSTVSSDTMSFLVETFNSKSTILKRVENDYNMDEIFPLPISSNDKPLLLITFYVPEGDVGGDFLAAYNGKTYEATDFNRIRSETIDR